MAKTMRLVDERLQDGQRICHLVLWLPRRRERVVPRREQLDPIRAAFNLFADRGAGLINRSDHGAGQRVLDHPDEVVRLGHDQAGDHLARV